jgi:hypothetical protein
MYTFRSAEDRSQVRDRLLSRTAGSHIKIARSHYFSKKTLIRGETAITESRGEALYATSSCALALLPLNPAPQLGNRPSEGVARRRSGSQVRLNRAQGMRISLTAPNVRRRRSAPAVAEEVQP